MKINLTDKGLEILGLKPNRRIINVPTDRAYLMMVEGCAVHDKGFMGLYEHANPRIIKKEKATSKKAAKSEKAVKK
jgi:hypothetical protein